MPSADADSPENVAAADDQRDLKPHIHHIGYFCTYL